MTTAELQQLEALVGDEKRITTVRNHNGGFMTTMNEHTYTLPERWKAVVTDTETRLFNARGERVLLWPTPIHEAVMLRRFYDAYQAGYERGIAQGKQEEQRRLCGVLGLETC